MLLLREQETTTQVKMARSPAGGRRWVSLNPGQLLLTDFSIPKINMPTMWMGFTLYTRNKNFHGTGVTEPKNSVLLLRDFEKKSQVTFGQSGQVH